ncbi:MAG: hypothetical protein A2X29_06785 [Elusimicrobia bacterium GWA2_64_40]|nr:MAG: hypothetical protein A2X29_06785 [Elusimicrobia bacterium GWA2_64_40]HAN05978.1 two-component sensor histidine kinase [Elusimicrobiota bacterium]
MEPFKKRLTLLAARAEVRVTAAYLAFGALWILFSDRFLYLAVSDPARQAALQTYKGWAYVAASAVLFYVLLRAETRVREATEERLRELNRTLEARVAARTAQLQEANEELEAFSYSVSHDLRAPLRAIEGFTRILEEDYGSRLDAEGRRVTGVIRGNTVKMGQLIEDLLSFARLARKELTLGTADMRALALAAWDEVVPPGWAGTFELGALPPARGDGAMLRQLWLNLFSNAVKFTSRTPAPAVRVSAAARGGMVEYSVSDNGAGFDQARAAKLFCIFQRLHTDEEFSGNGVGLSMVKRITARHGGQVRGSGRPGVGADFCFTLPAAESGGDLAA